MNWSYILGMAATIASLLPVLAVIRFRMYHHISLVALLLYYLFSAAYHILAQGLIPVSGAALRVVATVNNFLDAPLMLLVLHFFCPEPWKIRALRVTLLMFAAYELAIGFKLGFSVASNAYVLGPGVSIILLFSLFLFIRQIRLTVVQNKGQGKTWMLASIVFCYGCFGIIYLFHYIQKTNDVKDVFLLFYATTFTAALLMSLGLYFVQKYLKELEEVKNTRRELHVFFNS